MSYKNGMAAIDLEMPDLVPRTEYSAAEDNRRLNQAKTVRGTF